MTRSPIGDAFLKSMNRCCGVGRIAKAYRQSMLTTWYKASWLSSSGGWLSLSTMVVWAHFEPGCERSLQLPQGILACPRGQPGWRRWQRCPNVVGGVGRPRQSGVQDLE